jgi:hypothetical protein
VALAPDREVRLFPFYAADELTEYRSGDVPVAVDEAEVPAAPETETYTKSVAFALVDR